MSRKIFRVHTLEAVYVGPTEPHSTFPPSDLLATPDRVTEWALEELPSGDVIVTHRNPRARTHKVWDERLRSFRDVATPAGQVYVTRIPAGNLRDVQYEFEPAVAPAAQTKIKGAA